jgi:hypothetical protein
MIAINIKRYKYGDLEKFGKEQERIGNRMVNLMAEEFARYVRLSKLSGQVLSPASGKTKESVKFFKDKRRKSVFVVRPGVGIPGSLNYLTGFERGFQKGRLTGTKRPFMGPASKEFKAGKNHMKIMKNVYNKWLKLYFNDAPTEEVLL